MFHKLRDITPSVRSVLTGTAMVQLAGMGLTFLVGIQLPRSLGAIGYGVYGIALSMLSILAISVQFGLPQLVTREASKAHYQKDWALARGVLRWSYRTIFALSLPCLAIGAALVAWRGHTIGVELYGALAAGFMFVILVPLGNVFGAALRGLQHVVTGQLTEVILRPALFAGLLLVVRFMHGDYLSAPLAMGLQVLALAISVIVGYLLLRRVLPSGSTIGATGVHKTEWLIAVIPMALTDAIRVIQANLSILILGIMVPPAAVGIYRVATSVNALVLFPLAIVHIGLSPMFAQIHESSAREKMQRILPAVSWVMVVGAMTVTLLFLLFGKGLVTLVFGREFVNANEALLWLALGAILGAMFGPGASLLTMTGHERLVAIASAVSLALLVVLTPMLIGRMGMVGAAAANSASFMAWCAMMWWFSKQALGIDCSVFGSLMKPAQQ